VPCPTRTQNNQDAADWSIPLCVPMTIRALLPLDKSVRASVCVSYAVRNRTAIGAVDKRVDGT
jgi:hypothetical protein